jgi:pyruvate formate lyase activating enzyme
MAVLSMDTIRVGLQKLSLVDYPGKVATVFFLPGCNLSCPYCHNPDLVRSAGSTAGSPAGRDDAAWSALLPVAEALAHVHKRRDLLGAVVLSGGEPTLHAGLPTLAARIRALGLLVKLDTNGTLPDRIAAVQADYIAMDIKTAPAYYGRLRHGAMPDCQEAVLRSMQVIRRLGVAYEFRITCVPGIVGLSEAAMMADLFESGDPVFLQQYRPGRVLDPEWAAGVVPYTDAQLEQLLAVIRRKAPLASIRGTGRPG